jgi:hypothetical protein
VTDPRERWFDEQAGPVVRPYVIISGRPLSDHGDGIELTTLVRALNDPAHTTGLTKEEAQILRICQDEWLSVVEIAQRLPVDAFWGTPPRDQPQTDDLADAIDGFLGLPVAVVRILVAHLRNRGFVKVIHPSLNDLDDARLCQDLLRGLREL